MRLDYPPWTVAALLVALVLVPPAAAQAPLAAPPVTKHTLNGVGGVDLEVPSDPAHPWKAVKQDDVVLVLERQAIVDKGLSFGLLLVAVEQGPESVDAVDWKRVRSNVVDEAKKNGSDLRLESAGDWKAGPGVKGKRFKGSMTANGREVAVVMVAIASPGVLLTISEVAPNAAGVTTVEGVAKSARFGAAP